MAALNPREEIVFLLRGYFTCPLISFLGKRKVLDKMIDREFCIDEFEEIINKEIFHSILTYFESINLLKEGSAKERYQATEIGKKIFKRYGSFCLLHSYGNFLDLLENVLFDKNYRETPKVDRAENIIGSGQTNSRKYFPSAIEMLKKEGNVHKVIDVGSGNGAFLKLILENFPNCNVVGVDISEKATEETKKNLKISFKEANVKTILSDGRNASYWLPKSIEDDEKDKKIVITMWYLIHEISKKDPNEIINYLKEIYKSFPYAGIIIGEITAFPSSVLRENRFESIMPEFLFFHEISGQGVLSWQQYQEVIEKSPYKVKYEKVFDSIKDNNKETHSGFVWYLTPKEKLS